MIEIIKKLKNSPKLSLPRRRESTIQGKEWIPASAGITNQTSRGFFQRPDRIFVILLLLACCIGCDQATKAAARAYLPSAAPISYAGDFFRLQYTENMGAFLGFGSAFSQNIRFFLFTIVSGLALAGIFIFILMRRGFTPIKGIGLCLVLAGGTGNLIDRVLNTGTVIDFMNVGIGALRTGIFNFADLWITAGAGILLFQAYTHRNGSSHSPHPKSESLQ